MRLWSIRPRVGLLLVCVALLGSLAPRMSAGILLPIYGATFDGPSVLAQFEDGASPYTGIGRYEGRKWCTAFFVDTFVAAAPQRHAPAYALTNGHCVASSADPNEILEDRPGLGRITFNYFADSQLRRVIVPVTRTTYATMMGRDVAVLQLGATYGELTDKVVRPWRIGTARSVVTGDPIAVVGVPVTSDPAQEFLRVTACRHEGVAPLVIEGNWTWFDSPFNRCQDMRPGSSGSPVISLIDDSVVGMVNTTTFGAEPMAGCARGAPCELVEEGVHNRPGVNYVTPLTGVRECFTNGRFDLARERCPLRRRSQMTVTPSAVGAVNPQATELPLGHVRSAWDVAVSGTAWYRYAIAKPPQTDCRTATYGDLISVEQQPKVMVPLPWQEGFVMLCLLEATADPSAVAPIVLIARVDMTPPRVPARIVVQERPASWQVRLKLVGDEIAFYAVKVGDPRSVHCDEGGGYTLARTLEFALPRVEGPRRLCAIPYDAAQNAGGLFDRVIR